MLNCCLCYKTAPILNIGGVSTAMVNAAQNANSSLIQQNATPSENRNDNQETEPFLAGKHLYKVKEIYN